MAEKSPYSLIRETDAENGTVTLYPRYKKNHDKHPGELAADKVEVTLDDLFGQGTLKALKKLPNGEMAVEAMLRGTQTKVGDTVAQNMGEDAKEVSRRMQAIIDQIKAGTWNATRGGGASGRVGKEVRQIGKAIARLRGYSEDEAIQKVQQIKKDSPEDFKGLKSEPTVIQYWNEVIAEENKANAAQDDSGILDKI